MEDGSGGGSNRIWFKSKFDSREGNKMSCFALCSLFPSVLNSVIQGFSVENAADLTHEIQLTMEHFE